MNFEYIATSIPGPGSDANDFQLTYDGCSCSGACRSNRNCECLRFDNNYEGDRLKYLNPSYVVLECGSNCACNNSIELCTNRLVQNGIRVPLDCGQFVCEYAGEIISVDEARQRYRSIFPDGSNYIFILREYFSGSESPCVTCIDPRRKGNLGRFVNHSCMPNLLMVPVRYDVQIPHFGLFANRRIQAGEELSYSYGELKQCFCGSESCCGFLPYDPLL
ncbi:unnamed protein product [Soboliphyme baturini]|uniref:Histone-lysine N-methyltransferase SETMAR n=1 Tax=Soboliphyme baturini TaxID=241478 RepID=A0A183J829_9BILA|nr:unnamed protein product [Soboliphyme baturini]